MKRYKLGALMVLASCAIAGAQGSPQAHASGRILIQDATRVDNRIIAVGEHGRVLLSDDDGKTHRQALKVEADMMLTAVSFADSKNGWAVGHGGVILHTADGGETWQLQRQDIAVDQPLLTVHFRDAHHGWAAGLWSLLLSTEDGGETWHKISLPSPPGTKLADLNLLKIFSTSKGKLFIAAERGMVLRSEDGGASWKYIQTGSKASLWSGAVVAQGTLVVGGLGGRLLRSVDDGSTWSEVNANVGGSITHIERAGKQVWASTLDGQLLRSIDEGNSWQAVGDASGPVTAMAKRKDGTFLRYEISGDIK